MARKGTGIRQSLEATGREVLKGRVQFFQEIRGRCDIYLGVGSMKGTLVPSEKLRQVSRWEGDGSAGKAASRTQT